jgi:hypothetical protein
MATESVENRHSVENLWKYSRQPEFRKDRQQTVQRKKQKV